MQHTEYQIRVYPRGGRGQNARWEWVVYDLDGFTPLQKGQTVGAEKHAKSAANMAASNLYMDRRAKNDR